MDDPRGVPGFDGAVFDHFGDGKTKTRGEDGSCHGLVRVCVFVGEVGDVPVLDGDGVGGGGRG